MAKLSAHGHKLGRIEFTSYTKAYMADGKILKNAGFGWKLHAKVKDGVTPAQAFENAKASNQRFREARPAYAAYCDALHDLAGLSKRWKLHAAIELMPDDPDGVWSETCDGYCDNIHADIDEVSDLCRLYGAAILEADSLKKVAA